MAKVANVGIDRPAVKTNVHKAHKFLGFVDKGRTRVTAKHLGLDIVQGSMKHCESCVVDRAKQTRKGNKA